MQILLQTPAAMFISEKQVGLVSASLTTTGYEADDDITAVRHRCIVGAKVDDLFKYA
jgi:hypothetical protein